MMSCSAVERSPGGQCAYLISTSHALFINKVMVQVMQLIKFGE
jgi:hypothetical protein